MAISETTRINGLRALAQSKANAKAPLVGMVKNLLAETISSTVILFMPPPPKHSMCKYYGHIVDLANWVGEFPPCADCKQPIKSHHELRGSQAKA